MISTKVGILGGGEDSRNCLKRGLKLPRRSSHHIFHPWLIEIHQDMLAPGHSGFVIDKTTFALRMNVLEVLKDGEDEAEVDQLVGIGECRERLTRWRNSPSKYLGVVDQYLCD
jgi:hypothetical protein